jgi:hypothetical protein
MNGDKFLLVLLVAIMSLFAYSICYGSSLNELADLNPELRNGKISHIIARPNTPIEEDVVTLSEIAVKLMEKTNVTMDQVLLTIKNGDRYWTLNPKYQLCFSPLNRLAVLYNNNDRYVKILQPGANHRWIDMWLQNRDKYKSKYRGT